MEASRYLARLGYKGAPETSPECLRALHKSHLLAVPFENLDIHIGRPIVLEEERLLEKIVEQRRGGFCYELNGAFAWLLRSFGFEVELLSAAVARPDGSFDPPFDHLALAVRLQEWWLCDVGFGDSFIEPIRLETGASTQRNIDYRVVETSDFTDLFGDEDTRLLERRKENGPWEAQYVFSLRPRVLSDFSAMCQYHQTSPESIFTQKRSCSMATEEGRVTVTGNRLIQTDGDTRTERELKDSIEYQQVLSKLFGVSLDLTSIDKMR